MTTDIDQILDRIVDLSRQIEDLDPDSAKRAALIDERAALRARAQELSDARRHPDSVRAEIELIEARLAEIDEMLIEPASSEKWFKQTIQDPGAYRFTINRILDEDHADEVASLSERLERLRGLEAQLGSDSSAADHDTDGTSGRPTAP